MAYENPADKAVAGFGTRKVSMEEMLTRTARFKGLKPSRQAFVDTLIPGCEREIFNVIGGGVTEDTSLLPAITAVDGFNLAYARAEPGKGAQLHAHTTVEVFIAATGRWAIFWGDDAENEIILETMDAISVPTGVMRGFRNVGTETAMLIAVLGGTDSGRVTWHPRIIDESKKTPLRLDEHGNVVRVS